MSKPRRDGDAAAVVPGDAVAQARTRARQRLIGAIVLLGIGIIGFPLVFETQPRPIPVDLPIDIPAKDALPPLVAPASPSSVPSAAGVAAIRPARNPSAQAVITESEADAGREVAPPAAVAARTTASAVAASAPRAVATAEPPRLPAASASREATRPAAAHTAVAAPSPRKADDGARARALLEGRGTSAAATPPSQRFVLQVGAFADADSARVARQRVESLGLKTYTQVAKTAAGDRIRVRVGPFSSRGEADAALAKAKAGGLAAVVLTL